MFHALTERLRGSPLAARALPLSVDLAGDLTWSPDSKALLALPVDSSQPAQLVELDQGDAARAAPLVYDADRPFYAPPQWAPFTPAPPLGPPTVGGVGLEGAARSSSNAGRG